ncbi:MAG: cell division protein FtsX [Rhodobacteraceae bacterium]|nr:cell division protein FtsX [Paracoccaceae bacterium]
MSLNPLSFLFGDAASDQVVPPKGNAAWLTAFASAAMAFIAVFALTLSLAVGRLADYWSLDLARTATVQIVAEGDDLMAQSEAALRVLRTSPGIESAEIIDKSEQLALLEPWLGSNLPADTLPIPLMIDVHYGADSPDLNSLLLRLEAEAPGASYDDHSEWRAPVLEASQRLRLMVGLSLVLTAIITVIIVVLSAHSALASNQNIIRTLRLLGARDSYIARAFVRRITMRSTFGAVLGMALAMLVVVSFPAQPESNGLLSGMALSGVDWLYPIFVPVLVGISAFAASRLAARYHLHSVT